MAFRSSVLRLRSPGGFAIIVSVLLFAASTSAASRSTASGADASPTPRPTPSPSGGFLCSDGSFDGHACEGDDDCPGGSCVIPLGVCETGTDEGGFCVCPGAECTLACEDESCGGTCNAGVFATLGCDLVDNCVNGTSCISTQKLCVGGEYKGFPCLRDADCPGSHCRSTGGYCAGGFNDSFSCVDGDDCGDAECVFAGATPTPTPPPTPKPTPSCAGDCNDDEVVTVDELLTGVAIILFQAQVDACSNFDVDGNGSITIDELIRGVTSVLHGCRGPALPSSGRAEDQ